jgi:amino acid transporter
MAFRFDLLTYAELDETFHKPAMLAATIFSWYWIVICTSLNCITVAVYLIALVYPDLPYSDLPDGWVRFVAAVVQTVVCLLLYFARRLCFMFNSVFALFKIILLLVLFAAGMAACQKPESGLKDWGSTSHGVGGLKTLSAMIYVIYSYQGWEHTNYVGLLSPKSTLN